SGHDVQPVAHGVGGEIVLVDRTTRLVPLGHVGEFDEVVVGDVPVDLGIGLWIVPGDIGVLHATAGWSGGDVGGVSLGGHEEEQPVLDQRTTDVRAVGTAGSLFVTTGAVLQAGNFRCRVFVASGQVQIGIVNVPLFGPQLCRLEHHLSTELPVVGTTLTDLADHAAGRTTVLGCVTADVGLLLRDRAVRQREAAQVRQRFTGE